MTIPQNGWKFVAWWVSGLGAACAFAALGQVSLAAAVLGGLLGASVPGNSSTPRP